jgi:signal transduction histidine kinase
VRQIRPADFAFAGLLAVTGLLEVALVGTDSDRPVLTAVMALVAAGAMLLRSARPLLCLAIAVALVLVAHVPGTGLALTAALVVGCLLALGSVGRLCRDETSLPAAATTAGVFVIGAAFYARPWDVVVSMIGCGAAWGAGRILRREAQRNAELRSLAADLVAQRESRAVEAVQAERIRMARELHDTVAHTVSVMTLQVGGVRRRLDTDPAKTEERDVLLDVEELGRDAVAELHGLLGVLRAPDEESSIGVGGGTLRPHPQLADLQQLTDRVRAAGVSVELQVNGPSRPLPSGLELAGYRVVQEALTNVLKHGKGAAAHVCVTYTNASLELLIHDSGRDSDALPEAQSPGLGLTGISERVALYGGQLKAGPAPERGFQVLATLPVPTVSDP